MNGHLSSDIALKLRWIDRVVSFVWIGLSALMFVSAWLVYREIGFHGEFWFVILLVAATWTYPLYTLGFKLVPGLIGNSLYIALTVFVIVRVGQVTMVAVYLLSPVVLWVAIATVYVISQYLSQRQTGK